MKKITIIYWTSTGNTETMAEAIAEGTKSGDNGQNVHVNFKHVSKANKEDIISSDLVAFGSSAMGSESIDDYEMLPYIESVKSDLKDKATALFGSYDWGDGDWIEEWGKNMTIYGSKIIAEHLKVNLSPDEEGLKKCYSYGQFLQSFVLK